QTVGPLVRCFAHVSCGKLPPRLGHLANGPRDALRTRRGPDAIAGPRRTRTRLARLLGSPGTRLPGPSPQVGGGATSRTIRGSAPSSGGRPAAQRRSAALPAGGAVAARRQTDGGAPTLE